MKTRLAQFQNLIEFAEVNQNSFLNRFYYVFLFISLVGLVFYLGYLFGIRENYNTQADTIEITNPNGQKPNSISDIQQRPILGSSDGRTVKEFGQIYFLINSQKQTEIVINLQNVPQFVALAGGANQVAIPQQLEISLAKRVRDSAGQEDYQYVNISSNPEVVSYIALNEPLGGLRSGQYSAIINEPIFDPETGTRNFERIVFRTLNSQRTENENLAENIFIDPDTDLPILVRGNPAAGIAGQPAPFFWVKF